VVQVEELRLGKRRSWCHVSEWVGWRSWATGSVSHHQAGQSWYHTDVAMASMDLAVQSVWAAMMESHTLNAL
jgi:hypothetical protein